MEEEQEQRHCCRFCKKRFTCGRSLGGHMRSHLSDMNSAEADEKLQRKKALHDGGTHDNVGLESSSHAGYGLRENPKKTWRLSDWGGADSWKGKVCKECGKRFQSWKALFGHMRCHTEKKPSNSFVDEGSWSGGGGSHKLISDSQSDNEGGAAAGTAAPKQRRRSRRTAMRYGASPSFTNASSSVSEVEQEQEDVAICLMMLSRDVGSWGGLNSVVDSSDNNSVVLEVRSSGIDKRNSESGDAGFICDGGEMMKVKKKQKQKKIRDLDAPDMDSARFDGKRSEFDASKSGDGTKKVKSDVFDDELRKPELNGFSTEFTGLETGHGITNVELGKDVSSKDGMDCSEDEFGSDRHTKTRPNGCVAELVNDPSKDAGFSQVNDVGVGKYTSSKQARYDGHDEQSGGNFFKELRYNASDFEVRKKSRYQCTTCNKTFHSYQALGGHRASHKRIKGCCASKTDSSENSFKVDISASDPTDDNKKPSAVEHPSDGNGPRKIKGHECSICLKVFGSGQALGGHKRSHLIGNTESRENASQTTVIQQEVPEMPNLIDLNLPAPTDEASSSHVVLQSWWIKSSHKHESLVGLISN